MVAVAEPTSCAATATACGLTVGARNRSWVLRRRSTASIQIRAWSDGPEHGRRCAVAVPDLSLICSCTFLAGFDPRTCGPTTFSDTDSDTERYSASGVASFGGPRVPSAHRLEPALPATSFRFTGRYGARDGAERGGDAR